MNCRKCGKEISDDSVFCKYCGATLKKSDKKKSSHLITGITAGLVILAGLGAYMGYQYWREYKVLNPVISSPNEITHELIQKIMTKKDVVDFSEKAWQFCEDKGKSGRIAYLTSLAIEEMGKNVIEHGFTMDKKSHVLSARIVYKDDELIIRMRDNCKSFDPRKKFEQVYANEEAGGSMGIKMIMAEASEVRYTTMFNLNNLLIRIGK